jgi:predicted lactoylglutathione lyase
MGEQTRRIYVNLPVRDVAASVAYFRSLGFAFADESDDSAAMIVSDHAYVMLLSDARFAAFATQPGTEAILCVTAPTRDAVDRFADAALAAGGVPAKEPIDESFAYGRSFHDPDGHHWEVLWLSPETSTAGAG